MFNSTGHHRQRNALPRTHSSGSVDVDASPKRTKRVRRPPLPPSPPRNSPILYWVLGIGATLCMLEFYYLVQYVVPHGKENKRKMDNHNNNPQPNFLRVVPDVVPKAEEEIDDGNLIPGDHEDLDQTIHKPKSIFGAPELDHPLALDHPISPHQPGQHPAEPENPVADEDSSPDSTGEDEEEEAAVEASPNTSAQLNVSLSAGKEPLIALLRDAGVQVDDEIVERLPTWQQVADLYGSEPVIFGLETCQKFQTENGDPADHFVSTAGTFNTGTNLMAELLIHNCHMPARMKKYGHRNRGVRWQVLWGKHTPVGDEDFRLHHRTYNDTMNAEDIFPAVTVRDPFKWMQSMCRHKYAAHWHHDDAHCPSLIPNAADIAKYHHLRSEETIPVLVRYKEFDKHHTSMVDFWNTWYQEYVQAPFPRLIVRFEDIIFHPVEVTKIACECAGGQLNDGKFRYQVESAKRGTAHGKQKTSYVDSLIQYGSEQGRYDGYSAEDLKFAQQHLDPELMKLFGYKLAPTNLS
ncbi:hypothetical protein FisN_17Lh074 [Fistulifera solaris]|uniref:Sulfotransferase domain-containing protein n=1 Tax=Fistulifera solaris TaxID=1519565 RepID=A0A1Z5K1U9_FISSO|nr:hypothetical protein FisN_17Lh074 [Fistulifera solaris]|eukprot:GAX20122.1 hypothetical protein FisN_17Lh074 [Fistulifera solaris]